ncbi:MAG: hypothetical protein HYU64_10450 [Armatimonadetes bacterium]|nr:hypothetical protein [Armatimonadota bacterium]
MFSKRVLEELLNEVISSTASDAEKDLAKNLLDASQRFEDMALEELTLEGADRAMYAYLESAGADRKEKLRQLFRTARSRAGSQNTPPAVEMCRAILQDPQTTPAERHLAERFLMANFKSFHGEVME